MAEPSPRRTKTRASRAIKARTSRAANGKSIAKPLARATSLIALSPGFLGFDRASGFRYFAHHIAATLRGALESKSGRRSPVVALATRPSASLQARQQALFTQLRHWSDYHTVRQIKLVGHGTGGVDAYFALASTPLSGDGWTDEDAAVRERISHVVTLGTPHLGTTLADTAAAKMFGERALGASGASQLLEVGRAAYATAATHRDLPDLVRALWGHNGGEHYLGESPMALMRFLRELARNRKFLHDLSPARMLVHHQRVQRDHPARLTCFASVVRPPDPASASPLFHTLHDFTANTAATEEAFVERNLELLCAAPVLGHGERVPTPALDARSNDGIVNTLRQLPPDVTADEVAALTIADHADLLGYFDRYDPRTGQETQTSVFRSGARFRADQFFELFAHVARALS